MIQKAWITDPGEKTILNSFCILEISDREDDEHRQLFSLSLLKDNFSFISCPLYICSLDEIIPGHLLSTWVISKVQISLFTHPFTFGWKYLWISLDGKFLERIIKIRVIISQLFCCPPNTYKQICIYHSACTSTTYFVKWCFYLLKADRCQGPLLTLYLPISIHQNILLIWLSISGIHYFLHLFCHYGGWSHYILAILLQAPNWIYLSYPTYFC